jgi:hypothetical protein
MVHKLCDFAGVGMSIMRYSQLLLTGIATAVGLILLSGSSVRSQTQKTAPAAAAQAKPPGLQCNPVLMRDRMTLIASLEELFARVQIFGTELALAKYCQKERPSEQHHGTTIVA